MGSETMNPAPDRVGANVGRRPHRATAEPKVLIRRTKVPGSAPCGPYLGVLFLVSGTLTLAAGRDNPRSRKA